MGAEDGQLVIPDAAREDLKSAEVARVWVAKQGQHVSLRVDVWKDPAAGESYWRTWPGIWPTHMNRMPGSVLKTH